MSTDVIIGNNNILVGHKRLRQHELLPHLSFFPLAALGEVHLPGKVACADSVSLCARAVRMKQLVTEGPLANEQNVDATGEDPWDRRRLLTPHPTR